MPRTTNSGSSYFGRRYGLPSSSAGADTTCNISSSRLRKNAGTSSFRGAGFAREPGIQEHGSKKSMAWPVFMVSGPGHDGPSRNDARLFQHLAKLPTLPRIILPVPACAMKGRWDFGNNVRALPVSLVRHLHNFGSSGGARFWRHAFLADTRKLRIATIELPYSHYIYTGIGTLSGCGIVIVGVGDA